MTIRPKRRWCLCLKWMSSSPRGARRIAAKLPWLEVTPCGVCQQPATSNPLPAASSKLPAAAASCQQPAASCHHPAASCQHTSSDSCAAVISTGPRLACACTSSSWTRVRPRCRSHCRGSCCLVWVYIRAHVNLSELELLLICACGIWS